MNFRVIGLVALLCVSTGVSAKKYVPPPAPLGQDKPIEVILQQQEMGVEVPPTAANVGMQFGLIGALVGAAVQANQVSNAEKRVAEIRNLLVDYRFNQAVETSLRAKLATAGLSPQTQFHFMDTPWTAESAKRAGQVATNGVLMLAPIYSIQSDFESMKVQLRAVVVNRSFKASGKPKEKILFQRAYTVRFVLPKVTGSADDDAARWLALGKEPLVRMLDHGIQKATDQLFRDFALAAQGQGAAQFVEDWRWSRRADVFNAGYEAEFLVNPDNLARLAPGATPAAATAAVAAPLIDASMSAAPVAQASAAAQVAAPESATAPVASPDPAAAPAAAPSAPAAPAGDEAKPEAGAAAAAGA